MANTTPKTSSYLTDKRFEEVSMEHLRTHTSILKELGTKEIVKDRKLQKEGIDLICDIPRFFSQSLFKFKNKYVDVKAVSTMLPTFSFELLNDQSGNIGWFINDELKTEYYLLVYHEIDGCGCSYTRNKAAINVDNVIHTRALLIKKSKLRKYVEEQLNGVSYEQIIEEIQEESKDKKGRQKYVLSNKHIKEKDKNGGNEIYFTVSNQLRERPINVIIRRTKLEEMAERIWDVDGNGKNYIS